MPDPSINVALGYVIRNGDGSYVDGLDAHVNQSHVSDDSEAFQSYVDSELAGSGVAVSAYRYGLNLQGLAIVADVATKEADDWATVFSKVAPEQEKVAGARAELQQALDVLGLDDALRQDPDWLILLAYG